MSGLAAAAARLPAACLVDTYKASHYKLYPSGCHEMQAYATFRRGFSGDETDTRCVWFGLDWWIEKYLEPGWDPSEDVDGARRFFDTHLAPFHGAYPFPSEILKKALARTGGHFPVTIRALPAGTVVHPGVPLFTITAKRGFWRRKKKDDNDDGADGASSSEDSDDKDDDDDEDDDDDDEEEDDDDAGVPSLVTWLESLLTHSWYPSAVATLSRRARDEIEEAFERSVDFEDGGGRNSPLVASRLHDFGFRGATGVEASVLGGAAHLLSFEGTDTVPAAFAAQFGCNEGKPLASSIPATEHSVMTSHGDEKKALALEIDSYGDGIFACVADSYDYGAFLEEALPFAKRKLEEKRKKDASGGGGGGVGGFFVIRPDSGDPAEAVLRGLRAADEAFGSDANSRGFRVLRGCGVIQGDGVTSSRIGEILRAVVGAGFSAQNVAFGMGGGLLQSVNRDTMSFATKLCLVVVEKEGEGEGEGGEEGEGEGDGKKRKKKRRRLVSFDVMKAPRDDEGKASLPGRLAVVRDPDTGVLTAVPAAALSRKGERGKRGGGGKGGIGNGDGNGHEHGENGNAAAPFARFEGLRDELEVVFDCGPVPSRTRETFDELRERVRRQWEAAPKDTDSAVHPALRAWADEVRREGGRKESKW